MVLNVKGFVSLTAIIDIQLLCAIFKLWCID